MTHLKKPISIVEAICEVLGGLLFLRHLIKFAYFLADVVKNGSICSGLMVFGDRTMEYISVKQYAEKFNISERTARNYCVLAVKMTELISWGNRGMFLLMPCYLS